MPEFKNQKFKVASPAHSRAIQYELFKQGYKWTGHNGSVYEYEDKTALFTDDDGYILYGNSEDSFFETSKQYKEVTVVTKTVTKLVVTEFQPKREKVIVFGRTYYKDDVDAALAKLEVARV